MVTREETIAAVSLSTRIFDKSAFSLTSNYEHLRETIIILGGATQKGGGSRETSRTSTDIA